MVIFDKARVLCLIAFTLTASGCGNNNSNEPGAETTEPLILLDDALSTDGTTATELTVNTDTSDGLASSVTPVGSFQMDEYVENPLVTAVPAELNGAMSTSVSADYITNPLMD